MRSCKAMPEVIVCEVSCTRCAPLSERLTKHMSLAEVRVCADAWNVRGALPKSELAAAVAAAIIAARGTEP